MCFTIYISTDNPLPSIPYDEKNRNLNTEDITENEATLREVFSKSNIKYVGSDLGCGCGFRHSLLDGDNWLNVVDEDQTELDNSNHINLVELISTTNSESSTVEILSVWEGDHKEPIKYRETIKLSDILDEDFYFKERAFYIVQK